MHVFESVEAGYGRNLQSSTLTKEKVEQRNESKMNPSQVTGSCKAI